MGSPDTRPYSPGIQGIRERTEEEWQTRALRAIRDAAFDVALQRAGSPVEGTVLTSERAMDRLVAVLRADAAFRRNERAARRWQRHWPQSVNGCLFDTRAWSDHSPAEQSRTGSEYANPYLDAIGGKG